MVSFLNWLLPTLVAVAVLLVLLWGPHAKRWWAKHRSEPDPMKEAEVYLAYGRTQQAVYVLEVGLQRWPERQDIAEKLGQLKASR
ncbi:type IV pilus assembly protein FimV [Acidovorax kalamii]|uniref:type IV pilus assembly protein FimV n=1 Tax=Acidovorax kalamii TaxID=2004485 RepID=UPI0020914F66|nr:hypothetical protein [Acidovorax kalamii]MCO5358591.1 hypothetical protein [Acidovorax kalamii]